MGRRPACVAVQVTSARAHMASQERRTARANNSNSNGNNRAMAITRDTERARRPSSTWDNIGSADCGSLDLVWFGAQTFWAPLVKYRKMQPARSARHGPVLGVRASRAAHPNIKSSTPIHDRPPLRSNAAKYLKHDKRCNKKVHNAGTAHARRTTQARHK